MVCAFVAAPAAAAPTAAEVNATATAARAHVKGVTLDDEPGTPALWRLRWETLEAYAVDWLNQHPRDPKLGAGLIQADSSLQQVAIKQFPSGELVISVTSGQAGDVFMVRQDKGHFAPAWSIMTPDPAVERPALAPLKNWLPEAVKGGRTLYPADVDKLPPESGRANRFYVNAAYAQEAGATMGAQLSLWRWDGKAMTPLLVQDYTFMSDQAQLAKLDGNTLTLNTKRTFKRLMACGACEGRQVRMTFVLTDDGVERAGETSLTPELDLVDDLADRLLRHVPAGDLATPDAAAALDRQIRAHTAGGKSPDRLGLIQHWQVTSDAAAEQKTLCLALDDFGANRFTLRGGKDGWRITAVTPAKTNCDGPGSKS